MEKSYSSPGLVSPTQISHPFQDLLSINEQSTLADIISLQKDSIFKSWSSYIPVNFLKANNALPLKKKLSKTIKNWIYHLDELREETLFNKDELKELKKLAKTILHGQKTNILRDLLIKSEISDPKLTDLILRMEKKLICIISTPKINYQGQYVSSCLPLSAAFSLMRYGSLANQVLEKKESIQENLTASRFRRLSHENLHDWEKHLIYAFSNIETEAELSYAMRDMTLSQIAVITNYVLATAIEEWKIFVIFNALKFQDLLEILLGFTDEQISAFNYKLRGITNDYQTDLKKKIMVLRNEFITICNEKKEAIDTLAHYFRDPDNEIINITIGDLNDIEELLADIQHHKKITHKFFRLIDKLIGDKETRHVFSEIDAEYDLFIRRLTRDDEETPGCLYGILNRRAFDELTDLEDSIEIFGSWHILYPADYHEVGLLDNVTGNNFLDYKTGFNKMNELGLPTIGDLKKNKIYNRVLLKRFISSLK